MAATSTIFKTLRAAQMPVKAWRATADAEKKKARISQKILSSPCFDDFPATSNKMRGK